MSPPGLLAAASAGMAVLAVADARRWWRADHVVGRLDGPRPPDPPAIPRRVATALLAAGVTEGHALAWRGWLAAVAASVMTATVVPGGVVLAASVLAGPPVAVLACRGRAARLRAAQLPLALDTVSASLRGGASLRVAVADAAGVGPPLGAEFATVAAHADAGQPLDEALAEWAEVDDADTRLAGAALAVAATIGGPGADAVEAAAASVRDRAGARAEAAALSVQARLSAGVLTVAPVGFAVLLTAIDPASSKFLLASPVGWLCLAVGLGLDVLGGLWMARLVRSGR